MDRCDLSVVLCTYNRAEQLEPALNALVAQVGDVAYEVLVIDNNSTDHTRSVVERVAERSNGLIRYAFEAAQGLSNARNRGIELARAPIVAFSDDDVRVAEDWARQVVHTFDAHPDIDYVGGRVLPRWLQPPPRWLTTAHWSPLAVQDYGPQPFITSRERAICLVGANLAFRRRVFDRVGRFTPELGRIKDGIGSTEDHDMQLRVWRSGLRGLYAPAVVAVADVTPDRMVKAYHRRWHRGHGRHCAEMRLRELVPADLGPMSEPADIVTLFGSPGFVYADFALFARRWASALATGGDSFFYANKLRHIWSYLRRRRELHRAENARGTAAELAAFVEAYRQKRRARRAAHQTP
jgi:glycosyltransferase involved in cell wall biosynthesis